MEKECRKCHEVKPADEFPRRRGARDGLHSWCRVCMAEAAAGWRQRNQDRVNAYEQRRDHSARTERARERLVEQIREEVGPR